MLYDALRALNVPVDAQVPVIRAGDGVTIHLDLGVPAVRWGIELDIHPEHRSVDGHQRDARRVRGLHDSDWQIEPVSELDMADRRDASPTSSPSCIASAQLVRVFGAPDPVRHSASVGSDTRIRGAVDSRVMDYSDALAYLADHVSYDLTGRIESPTLERITRLTSAMGDPQHTYPVIHVTGTNGKGSTSQMITRLLMASGLTVGTYTSPHLDRVNERIVAELRADRR